MAKPKDRKERKPSAGAVIRLPNFGAEAALGPASRTYRSPMEAYPNASAASVLPSQMGLDATGEEETDMEGAEIDAEGDDEAIGDTGAEEADEGEDEEGEDEEGEDEEG